MSDKLDLSVFLMGGGGGGGKLPLHFRRQT